MSTSSGRNGKNKPSLSQFAQYHFENLLSRGTIAIIGVLFLLVAAIVVIGAVIITAFGLTGGEQPMSFGEAAWNSLMHQIDSGMVTADNNWGFRVVAFLVTIGGIFIFSSLIGVLNAGLESKLEDMRKGRSHVLENNHTLILGWSSKIFTIVSELVIANESERHPRIVILADRDKVEMEDELRSRIEHFGRTKVICRSGSPIDPTDRDMVNPNGAKSIIVLAPETEDPDIFVIKAVLAITNNPARKAEPYHIVAENYDEAYREAAGLVGGDEAAFVEGQDLIARMTAQTCRQSGLSIVYTELLDFGGSEMYFKKEPALVGKTFHDALFAYPHSSPIGVMAPDGKIMLNPPMTTIISDKHEIIGLSEDDSTFVIDPQSRAEFIESAIVRKTTEQGNPEDNLILGWNSKIETIITELDKYLAPGSRLAVMSDGASDIAKAALAGIELKNQTVSYRQGDITRRENLDAINLGSFNNIIILGDQDLPIQEADARTLITLLHLRHYSVESGRELNIVSEMFDVRNRDLAEVARADDFIVSDRLISLMLSQLSENKHLRGVFDELFSADGPEIYLFPVSDYVQCGIEMDFRTLLESVARNGQVAFGYRIVADAHEADKGYGVVVNPRKSDRIVFQPDDKVIIIAES